MENIYQRKRESENMKFCTDILRYIQLESDRYDNSCAKRNKFHESNDSFNETNDETLGNKDEKVESQSGLRRTNSYPTIFEGDISENLSENSIGLLPNDTKLLKNKTLLSLLQNQTKLLNGETLYQGESNSCDKGFEEDTIPYVTVSDENGIKFDKSQNANVVDNDTDNESEVDQEPIQSYHKRKSWSREKSHSTADISCPGKKDSFVNKCKVTVEEASQVVEARRRSHHFLWTIPDPGSQKLNWHKPPLTVLVVKKIYDESVLEPFTQLISWLIESRKMIVFVENNVMEDDIFGDDWEKKYRGRLQTFKLVHDDLTDKIDFIICLGGDGTLLHASSLFQQSCPPVMAFHQGSLGFLTPFSFDDFHTQVTNVLEGNASLLLRYRLKCVICKEDSELGRVSRIKNIDRTSPCANSQILELGRVSRIKNIDRTSPCANSQILVLNEVVVDRGSSSYICNIDLYVEGRHVTSVQGDGLIISTPTGSTAYAVAAGASMIHPNVPAIMITPICPHSLSFRPIVVPAGVELKIMLSPEARGAAMVSFDGRNRQEIHQGDSVRITTAQYPLPAVCAKDQIDDWFDRLAECLHWNVRKPQKMLSVSSTTSEHSNHSNHSVSSSLTNSQNNSTDEIDEGTS